jgi:hypothetical protein
MFRITKAACLLALISLFSIQLVSAQTALMPRSAFLDSIHSSVVKSIGAQDRTVEITLTDSVLTVLRVNSNQNVSSHAGRNNEATSIADIASRAFINDVTGASVHTIRVQYLTRDSANVDSAVIDTVEFRKNAKGEFEIHLT